MFFWTTGLLLLALLFVMFAEPEFPGHGIRGMRFALWGWKIPAIVAAGVFGNLAAGLLIFWAFRNPFPWYMGKDALVGFFVVRFTRRHFGGTRLGTVTEIVSGSALAFFLLH
jgi:hypothetical protein